MSRERLYRGRCSNNEHLPASIQAFRENKAAIYDLVNSNELYKTGTRKDTLRFLNEFYEVIEESETGRVRLIDKCL